MYDDDGNPEKVFVAKEKDRVIKDGAKNSHKVIDKLARYKGDNVKALATVHLSEMLETSFVDENSTEHKHQWMDENDCDYRKTYIEDLHGNIYEATLNIANGRDRRIIYEINNFRQIDKRRTSDGAVPLTDNGLGSHINRSSSFDSIPDSSPKSNSEFSIKGADLLYQATGGLYSSYFEELHEKGISEKGKGTIGKVAGAVPFANMIVEQAPRLAELMSILEKGDMNDPDTVADALLAAAEVTTNFGESGTWGKVLNKISRIYLL